MGERPIELLMPMWVELPDPAASGNAAVRWIYDPRDPFAVTVEIHGDGESRRWTFARDLLLQGLRHHVGIADVQVEYLDVHTLSVWLSSPDGSMVLAGCRQQLAQWVGRVFRLVPPGEEQVDVDTALTRLLATGGEVR